MISIINDSNPSINSIHANTSIPNFTVTAVATNGAVPPNNAIAILKENAIAEYFVSIFGNNNTAHAPVGA